MDVGVRELKAHLSEYLDRAARGEVIVVTDRGRPKATLGPVEGLARLTTGVSEGWVAEPEVLLAAEPVVRYRASRRTEDALDEDRDG